MVKSEIVNILGKLIEKIFDRSTLPYWVTFHLLEKVVDASSAKTMIALKGLKIDTKIGSCMNSLLVPTLNKMDVQHKKYFRYYQVFF